MGKLYKPVYGPEMLIYGWLRRMLLSLFELTDQEIVCPGWTPAVTAADCLKMRSTLISQVTG